MGIALKSGDIVFLDTAPFIYFFAMICLHIRFAFLTNEHVVVRGGW